MTRDTGNVKRTCHMVRHPGHGRRPQVCGVATSRAGSRCTEHARQPTRRRHTALHRTRAWQRLSARVLRAWRGDHGNWCPGCQRPAHVATDLTVDHVVPLAHTVRRSTSATPQCCAGRATRRRVRRPGGAALPIEAARFLADRQRGAPHPERQGSRPRNSIPTGLPARSRSAAQSCPVSSSHKTAVSATPPSLTSANAKYASHRHAARRQVLSPRPCSSGSMSSG